VFVHALSGAASFAACLRLFRSYPLAVAPNYRDESSRSIVLRHRSADGTSCYVLTHDQADQFTLKPWGTSDSACRHIRPGEQVTAAIHRVITEGMPVPRDGALLGWVADRQATVLLSAYHGVPGYQGLTEAGGGQAAARIRVQGPQVRVLALVGTQPLQWPPFTVSPLDDGRLWQYIERGDLVDVAPLLASGGGSFWVPSQNQKRADLGHGCVVVGKNLAGEDYWLSAGVYMDHWMLREGVPTPPASHLLTLPGARELGGRVAACAT
jgi:hypothetical protein